MKISFLNKSPRFRTTISAFVAVGISAGFCALATRYTESRLKKPDISADPAASTSQSLSSISPKPSPTIKTEQPICVCRGYNLLSPHAFSERDFADKGFPKAKTSSGLPPAPMNCFLPNPHLFLGGVDSKTKAEAKKPGAFLTVCDLNTITAGKVKEHSSNEICWVLNGHVLWVKKPEGRDIEFVPCEPESLPSMPPDLPEYMVPFLL